MEASVLVCMFCFLGTTVTESWPQVSRDHGQMDINGLGPTGCDAKRRLRARCRRGAPAIVNLR
jgi:hypothetical protein